MKEELIRKIVLEEGVQAELVDSTLKLKGAQGEIERVFLHPKVSLKLEPGKIILQAVKATKREKKIIGSFEAHIKNMLKGIKETHIYKLKICSGHFPMNVSVSGNELIIKNFLGESVPRKAVVFPNVKIEIKGQEILLIGVDKEKVGQMAARIENLCRVTNRDLRIFQDGCYITHKAGKDLV